jgi:hypothetical protein
LVGLLGALALVATACGNDDGPASAGGGGGGGAMSEQAFCNMIAEIEEDADDLDDAEAIAMFGRMAQRAPNPELREAMLRLADAAELLEDLDDDDPESIGEAFALMFDPDFVAAAETIERFMSDTCGIDTGSDWDDWDDED